MRAPTIKAYFVFAYTIHESFATCACVISALLRKTILKTDGFFLLGISPL